MNRETVAGLRGSLVAVDVGRLDLSAGVYVALVGSALSAVAFATGRPQDALSVTLGTLFAVVPVAFAGRVPRKVRLSVWAVSTLVLTVCVLVAGLASDDVVARLVVSTLVAAGAGLATAYGRVPGAIGVLSTVLVTAAAGVPETVSLDLRSVAMFVAGCAAAVPFALSGAGPDRLALSRPSGGLRGLPAVTRRHALRYAAAILLATAVAALIQTPHAYWMPLTVAWVLKPDTKTSVLVIAQRLVGTLVGIGVVGFLVGVLGVDGLALSVVSAVMGGVCLLFLASNYSLATAGITGLMLAGFTVAGEPIIDTLGLRALDTLIGAVIALLLLAVLRDAEQEATSRR